MLGYLKSFYKLRPRAERAPTVTGLDMRGQNEIIADGFLSFVQPDNTNFTATFEATAHETRKEILYRKRLTHILWDSAAMSLAILVVLISIFHINEVYFMEVYGFWNFLIAIIVFFLSTLIILRYSIMVFPRYRYIFAIEQFKQYEANDQWIAFGYDVFSSKERRKKAELIKQCRKYGFGLVEIDARRRPNLIMAPSRAQNFVPKDSFTRLIPLGQWREHFDRATSGPIARLKKSIRQLIKPYEAHYSRWFPRTYYTQWAICLAGLIAISFQFRVEYFKLPFRYVPEGIYHNQLANKAKDARRETEYFKVDAPQPGFLDSNFAPFIVPTNEEQFENIIQTSGSKHADSISLPPVRIVSAHPGEQTALYYDCERFSAQRESFFVLVDTLVNSMADARHRLSYLNDHGLAGTAVWPKCLGGPNDGFLILVDEIHLDIFNANLYRDSLQLQLDTLGHQLIVREFFPASRYD